jgi:predicted kinase
MLIGIQATGKSTFCRDRLFHTHFRINGDLLAGNKETEQELMLACLRGGQSFVLDKMNFSKEARAPYLEQWKYFGFLRVGYVFLSSVSAAQRRNAQRPTEQRVPADAVSAIGTKLERPTYEEGFDRLYLVHLDEEHHDFTIEEFFGTPLGR